MQSHFHCFEGSLPGGLSELLLGNHVSVLFRFTDRLFVIALGVSSLALMLLVKHLEREREVVVLLLLSLWLYYVMIFNAFLIVHQLLVSKLARQGCTNLDADCLLTRKRIV